MSRVLLALAVVASMAAPVAARRADPLMALSAQAGERNRALVEEGFNLTRTLTLGAAPMTVELLFAPSDDASTVVLWFEAADGELDVRLLDPSGATVASWRGRAGEARTTAKRAPGRYRLEIRGTGVTAASGLVGVKGAVVGECLLDAKRVVEYPADPAHGFAWPYLLALPKQVTAKALLVMPNNTGFATEDLELIRAQGRCSVAQGLDVAERLGTPVLVPLFPRPMLAGTADNLYLHALSRAALATKEPRYARVDRQLVGMIDDARARLAKQKITVGPRVLIGGFSAAGSFANRFALLHPARTLAAAVGSPGGWPTVPLAVDGKDRLPYPVGVADLDKLTGAKVDTKALAKVRLFFFLGANDLNDAVPYRDSFSASDETLVMRKYGKTPVARWKAAQRLYERAKLTAEFKLYPGVAHNVTLDMRRDLEAAFAAALQ